MASEQECQSLVVGLDGHLFTKRTVDALKKVDGVEIVVNDGYIPVVEDVIKVDKGNK